MMLGLLREVKEFVLSAINGPGQPPTHPLGLGELDTHTRHTSIDCDKLSRSLDPTSAVLISLGS